MGKICYDCATEKINGICPNCYPSDIRTTPMDKKVKEIEEVLGISIEQLLDCYQVTSYEQKLHLTITLLLPLLSEKDKKIEELEELGPPAVPLVFCKEHKAICMPFMGELSCCLRARIKSMEEGIEKHRNSMALIIHPITVYDEQLYNLIKVNKLLEKKGE